MQLCGNDCVGHYFSTHYAAAGAKGATKVAENDFSARKLPLNLTGRGAKALAGKLGVKKIASGKVEAPVTVPIVECYSPTTSFARPCHGQPSRPSASGIADQTR